MAVEATGPDGSLVDILSNDVGGDFTYFLDTEDVPEPSTYAMMVGGLAILEFCHLRRKAPLLVSRR